MKQISAMVEDDDYAKFQGIVGHGNVSNSLRQYMRSVIDTQDGESLGIDKTLLMNDRDRLMKMLTETQASLKQVNLRLEQIDIQAKNKEEKRLNAEKEAIERSKHCPVCAHFIQEGSVMLIKREATGEKVGVCKGCFHTYGHFDLQEKLELYYKGIEEGDSKTNA